MTAPVLVIARKEVRDAQRNRWFLLYAAAFAALALGLARLALGTGATAGLAGFGRTAASLVNLVLLTVPLMGLSLGAASLAAEREAGTLATLMAQPVLPGEVLLGKFIGLSASLGAAVAIGFGLAGAVVAYSGGAVGAGTYAALVGLSLLVGLAMVSVGLLVSALAPSASAAQGTALFLWLVLVLLGDLGIMGTAVALRLGTDTLFVLTVASPLQSMKVAAVGAMNGGLDVLGPAGAYAVRAYGRALQPLLVGILVLWCIVPLALAGRIFRRQGYA